MITTHRSFFVQCVWRYSRREIRAGAQIIRDQKCVNANLQLSYAFRMIGCMFEWPTGLSGGAKMNNGAAPIGGGKSEWLDLASKSIN